MYKTKRLSLEAISRFAEASEEIRFESKSSQQVYGWVERLPVQREYAQQSKAARGRVRRNIEKMTGLSRAHDYEDEYLLKTSWLWDMRSVRKSSSLGGNMLAFILDTSQHGVQRALRRALSKLCQNRMLSDFSISFPVTKSDIPL